MMLGLFDDKKQIYTRELYIDELTGALNRRYLNLIVDREIQRSRRYKHKFSVLIADLDNFKTINDTFGHLAGDRALRFFAKNIKDSLRSADSVIRYGGDEFIIIMPNTDIEGAKRVGERIITLLKSRDFEGIKLSASIGVATFPEHGNSWDEVFQAADQALYTSKRLGKSRVSTPGGSIKNLVLPTKTLVGRREEISWITSRKQNSGVLHIVKGEVGIGKTRLVLDTLASTYTPYAYARSMGPLRDVSYFLIRDLLDNLLKHHRDGVFSAFDRLSETQRGEIAKFMPDIFKQHSKVPSSGDKYTLYEALISFLNYVETEGKLVLVFDDLQWVDRESAEFVHYIIEKQPDNLVFFGIYRTEEVEKSPIYEVITLLSRMRYTEELHLRPLSREETGAMLQAALGAPPAGNLTDIIYEESGGNPFFIEEILRQLYEENWIYYENDIWNIKENYKISPSQNIEQIIERKLQELSERERLVLDYSSVCGRELDATILSKASGLNEGEVFDILDRLVRVNILKEGTVSDYVFMEGVIREIVERRLSRGKLKYYHKVIARTIEEVYAATLKDHYEELVHHYEIAGDYDKKRYYSKLAGDKAFEVYAFERALFYYKKAIDGLPPGDEVFKIQQKIIECYKNLGDHRKAIRELESIKDIYPDRAFEIYDMLADSHMRLGEWNKAIEYYKKSIESADDEENKYHVEVELAWALINTGKYQEAQEILNRAMEFFKNIENEEHKKIMFIWIYTSLATMANNEQRYEEAVKYYGEALKYSEELNHHYNIAVSHLNMGIALSSMGDPHKAMEHYRKALEISRKDNYLYLVSIVMQNIAQLHSQEGEFNKALKDLLALEKDFKLTKNKYNLMFNYLDLSDVYYYIGEFEKAKEAAKEAEKLAIESGVPHYTIYAKFNLFRVLIEENKYEEALKILDSIDVNDKNLPDKTVYYTLMENYAKIYEKIGEYRKALEYLEKALKYLEEFSLPESLKTSIYFALAEVYSKLGEYKSAWEYINKALNVESEIKSNFQKNIFHYDYAKALYSVGEKDKALNIFKDLLSYFNRTGATLFANKVKSYLK